MKGFDKRQFEADNFVFRRGTGRKYYNGWSDVRYESGLSPMNVDERELEDGEMRKPLYDFLCHVYGEQEMSKYFPAPEPERARPVILRDTPGAAMAAAVDGTRQQAVPVRQEQPKRLSKEEQAIEDLATLMFGSVNEVSYILNRGK